jgi:hypothetical protein
LKNIGLYNIEPKINNTALMQISHYHKSIGDRVSWHSGGSYDRVYCSSLFDFTDKKNLPPNTACGGSGFDVYSRLPPEIEQAQLDYSIYPDCKLSYLWFTRGCNKNCPFCIVRKKEGPLHTVSPKNLNLNGEFLKIMDNSFFAAPNWKESVQYILNTKQKVKDFEGIDLFTIDEEVAYYLTKKIKFKRNDYALRIAWDNPRVDITPKLEEVIKWIRPYRFTCYVLIGYWSTPEEDLYRVETLRKFNIIPFIMPYNKKEFYQRNFARWGNSKQIYKSVKWKEYKPYWDRLDTQIDPL